jgi:hypothetical protein
MKPWTCVIKQPESWTVGGLTNMDCSGELLTNEVNAENTSIVRFADKADQYKLKILTEVKFEKSIAEFVVTSYKPGDHQNLSFEIVKGEVVIPVAPVSYSVKSVLDPQQPSQPQGPFGPYFLSYPIWVWMTLLLIFIAAVYSVVYPVRQRKKNKKLQTEMAAIKTPIPASHQLRKDLVLFMRKLESQSLEPSAAEAKEEFYTIFRHYLVRQFIVPAHVKSPISCLKEINKKFPRASIMWSEDLKRVANEVKNIKEGNGWTISDFEQIVATLSRLSEKIQTTIAIESKKGAV